MNTKDTYNAVFVSIFSLEPDQLGDKVAYNEVPSWDSIGHMTMIAALEDAFGISMETEDVINFSSYQKGFEILTKYGVKFGA